MAKTSVRQESLGIKILGWIFAGIPLALANGILQILDRRSKTGIKWFLLAGVLAVSLAFIGCLRWVLNYLPSLGPEGEGYSATALGFRGLLFYLAYIIVLLPVFILIAHLMKQDREGMFKGADNKTNPDVLRMRRERLSTDRKRAYLGQSFNTGKPLHLTNDQRLMHTEVVGSTGTGKTESVLLPLLAQDLAHRKGAIIIDGKGDLELLDRIQYIILKQKRERDFYFFSLAHPQKSHTYNPLLRGNATELKDKIVGSMPWSEEFYRRMAEQACLTLLNVLVAQGEKVKFEDLHDYLTSLEALSNLVKRTKDEGHKSDLGKMVNQFKNNPKFLSGLMADLFLTARSEFSHLVNVDDPEIDLLDVYQKNHIVYFQLNLQGYGDTAKRMGRMILQDIRTVSSFIQSHLREFKRHFFPVFVDDASSFLDLNFIDFLNKARASGFAITLLHQSLGDLLIRRDFAFQQQVIENTNIKIIMRQDDPQSIEKLTRIGGTRKTMISTYQTEDRFLGKGFTGVGSIREGQTFRVDPDLIRSLRRGEAIVIWKSPSFRTDYVKLDFFGHPLFRGEFEPIHRKKEVEPTPETPKENKPPEAPPVQANEMPPDIDAPLAVVQDIERKNRMMKK
jgi:type IV secretory pathway TraG/TraD family ATPase VirD4